MRLVILETIQVLVPLAADIALVGLLFLHTQCSRVCLESIGIDNGKSAVGVFVEFLGVVTVLERT
jgi:hypothetical protein